MTEIPVTGGEAPVKKRKDEATKVKASPSKPEEVTSQQSDTAQGGSLRDHFRQPCPYCTKKATKDTPEKVVLTSRGGQSAVKIYYYCPTPGCKYRHDIAKPKSKVTPIREGQSLGGVS